ncbi:MAG: TRAP transporter small permease [Betaproteobacteria bacterium]|nr:TRAP transporter small permease [Betaproteobacteria bacterium]
MEKLLGRLVALIEWWTVCLLAAMWVVVCLGVFFRYVLNASLVWYDEFASYLLVWLTFFGAVVAAYHRRHIGFELVVDKLAPWARRAVDFVGEAAVLGFQFVLLYYGWILAQRMGDETAISLPWVKVVWVTSVMPITGGLMFLISLTRLAGILSRRPNAQEAQGTWSGSSSE